MTEPIEPGNSRWRRYCKKLNKKYIIVGGVYLVIMIAALFIPFPHPLIGPVFITFTIGQLWLCKLYFKPSKKKTENKLDDQQK